VQILLAALAGLALAPDCGSSSPGKAPGNDAGTDAGDAASSLWETMVPPSHDYYRSIWLGAPGTIYAVAQNDPSLDSGTAYSMASSHDDGATWTMVPLTTESTQIILAGVAIGATDVYGFGFTLPDLAAAPPTPLVAKSTDGGATFTLLHPTFSGSLNAAGVDGAGNPIGVGLTYGGGGFFVRSTDGGTTWTRVAVPGTIDLYALWTAPSGTIYACGAPSTASAPSDGGTDAAPPDGGTDAGASDAGPPPGGVVVRSNDNGNTWATVTTTPNALYAISGSLGGQRVLAVGAGSTEVQSDDSGASWFVYIDDSGLDNGNNASTYSNFTGVWVPPGYVSQPYIAAGGAPYVLAGLVSTGGYLFAGDFQEALPTPGQSGANVLAATADGTELWAAGTGIFRQQYGQ
jgi:hypothetical protein